MRRILGRNKTVVTVIEEENNGHDREQDDIVEGLDDEKEILAEPVGFMPPTDALQGRRYVLEIMAKQTYVEGKEQDLICHAMNEAEGRSVIQCVALRVIKGDFVVYPRIKPIFSPLIASLSTLNVGAAMTLVNVITEGLVEMIPPEAREVAVNASLRIQVCRDVSEISKARKAQGAAFLVPEKSIIIWCDEPFDLLNNAQRIHQSLEAFIWEIASAKSACSNRSSRLYFDSEVTATSGVQSPAIELDRDSASNSRKPSETDLTDIESLRPRLLINELSYDDSFDAEKGGDQDGERPTIVLAAMIHGMAFALALLVCLLQVRQALRWSLLDGQWIRMAVAIISPVLFFIIMFFCDNIFGVLLMLFGPVGQLHTNSRYYSGKPPVRLIPSILPRITVQMPVYKEDFAFVLKPSFESIKKAIQTYELQGGSASIIVSEDGMNLVDEEEQQTRMQYYDENNITWIARPKHNKDGFIRPGRFKKASNMNFTYDVLAKAQARFEAQAGEQSADIKSYDECLAEVLSGIHTDARGFGKEQMGEFLLLVDSDTRIPEDCLLDAALEMTQCKDVGILQHCSGVMYVSTSFFEQCIGYFTRIVNFSISFVVSNGDMAPFMGHNAYLRWEAMKEIARQEVDSSGRTSLKIWSEEHVSEDFVMALDMIDKGYTVRWATYSKSEYLEGVSLSCDDELNRWQKYSWGVSEMIFNPIRQWWYRGPITPLFRRFLFSKTPIHYKWASCSYCFSYYSIGLALPMSLGMALVQGWIGPDADVPYLPSFQVLVACIFVFLIGGTTSICVVRFRAGLGGLFALLGENIKFMPFFTIFFGGLPYHISTALVSHLLGINMTWGATLKDIEMTNFFIEAPLVLKRHWRLLTLCFTVLGGLIMLATNLLPLEWRLQGFYTIFPCYLCYTFHILYPFLLNPSLLRFSF